MDRGQSLIIPPLFNSINYACWKVRMRVFLQSLDEKEAWTILKTTYEGTKDVKDSKLQRLTTSFEEIKMEEDESFDKFYAKLKDIVNLAFNLGETIPEPKIVKKVLKSLPERFHAKITAIEE